MPLLSYRLFTSIVYLFSAFICPVFYQVFDIGVVWRGYSVIVGIEVVSAFDGVGMHDAKFLIKDHSSASFLSLLLVPISRLHVLARKDALLELKVDAVAGQDAGKDLAFHLLHELVNGITECKVALECGVRVQVDVHEQSLILGVVLPELLDCPAGRLALRVWRTVKSIQVLVEDVHAAMPSGHPVGIEHGD